METIWLSYDELAERLGITAASAKRLTIRRKWQKRPGNDGRSRVAVPVEKLTASKPVTSDAAGDDTGGATRDTTGGATGDDTRDMTEAVAILTRHVTRLEGDPDVTRVKLEAAERDRDAECARAAAAELRAAELEGLRAVLEVEKRVAEGLRADRDRWVLQAHALAHPPVLPAPALTSSRGFLGWFRAAR